MQYRGKISDPYDVATKGYVDQMDTAKQPKKLSITLPATWAGNGPYTQTVTIANAGNGSQVDLQMDAAVLAQLAADGVHALYISNNSGVFTANAIGAKPSKSITVSCSVANVNATEGAVIVGAPIIVGGSGIDRLAVAANNGKLIVVKNGDFAAASLDEVAELYQGGRY